MCNQFCNNCLRLFPILAVPYHEHVLNPVSKYIDIFLYGFPVAFQTRNQIVDAELYKQSLLQN